MTLVLSDGPQERKGDTALKPSVKNLRYLAALAPLALGVALAGCGGLLGSVEGTGPAPTVPPPGSVVIPQTPAPAPLPVAGTFTVTGQSAGRGRVFTATTARLVFITAAGQRVVVDTQTPVPAAGYTLTANLANFPGTDFSRGLWTVEVEGDDDGVAQAFAAPFLPPTTTDATISGVDANGATSVAVALLADLVNDPGFVLTADFADAIQAAIQAGQALAPSLAATAFNNTDFAAVLAQLQTALPALVNAAVDEIVVTIDGSPVPATFDLFQTGSVNITAQARLNGQPVAFPIEWVLEPADGGNVLTAVAFGGDSLWVRGDALGTVSVTARVAGNSRSTTFNVRVVAVPHPGHTQGSGIGG